MECRKLCRESSLEEAHVVSVAVPLRSQKAPRERNAVFLETKRHFQFSRSEAHGSTYSSGAIGTHVPSLLLLHGRELVVGDVRVDDFTTTTISLLLYYHPSSSLLDDLLVYRLN